MSSAKTGSRVLIVDDQLPMAETIAEGLADHGFETVAVEDGVAALTELERTPFDALVTDLRMRPMDGLELLRRSRESNPERPVIVMTAYGAVDTAVESIRRGAYHYLTKPFKLDELIIFLERALEESRVRREAGVLRRAMLEHLSGSGIVGHSRAMVRVMELVERLADAATPVLITGETGTGKSLVAAALHGRSRRATGPFVTINCAALPENLLESELFGHVKGAFTGATSARNGLFVDADGGTLFLDEVGDMSLALQAKLLDVLERRRVRPVGGAKERDVDVRVLAATNRNLRDAVKEGSFREDLLYRLDVVSIDIPPLRQRHDDIPTLIDHFLRRAKAEHPQSPVEGFSNDAIQTLLSYAWPGNVRELAHVVERTVLLGSAPIAHRADLPDPLVGSASATGQAFGGEVIPIRELQHAYTAWALRQCGGNKTRTAEKLGIDYKTLLRWLDDDRGGAGTGSAT